MADLIHAVLYPFANKKNILNFLIAAVLNIGWFLFIPVFFVNGYLVKVIRNTIQGNESMPDWSLKLPDLWYMLRHGFIFTLIIFVYLLVPVVLALIGTSGISVSPVSGAVPAVSGASWGLMIASLVTLLIAVFFLPMALVFYAGTEKITQAFNIPEMMARIAQKWLDYLLTFVVGAFILVITVFIGSFLSVFMGVILIYPWIFSMHAFAQVFEETQ